MNHQWMTMDEALLDYDLFGSIAWPGVEAMKDWLTVMTR